MLRRVATCWVLLARILFKMIKLEPTTPNMSQHGGQTHLTCCAQQCCDMSRSFGRGFIYTVGASECKIYVLESFRRYSPEIVLQPILFVADVEFDDEEIKRGVPDPPKIEEGLDLQDVELDDEEIKQGVPDPLKIEEGLDSQEESTEVDNEEQVNKNLSLVEADSDMEGKLVESSEEQSSNKACGFDCII